MNKNIALLLGIIVLIIAGAVVFSKNNGQNAELSSNPASPAPTTQAQSAQPTVSSTPTEPQAANSQSFYQDYSTDKLALANSGKVMIFFHAKWCPICQSLEKDILSNITSAPQNAYVLKADFDKETELKKKYGVTVQTTFVEVDASGAMISKFNDVTTFDQLKAKFN